MDLPPIDKKSLDADAGRILLRIRRNVRNVSDRIGTMVTPREALVMGWHSEPPREAAKSRVR